MAILITDPILERRLKTERRDRGIDGQDEIWDGTYIIGTPADNEHQDIRARLGTVFQYIVGWDSEAHVRLGVNVSDRDKDWQFNYRCPDVVVFLPNTAAQNRGSHWSADPISP